MKAVILAGGQGTRLSEETSLRPKPMVEIGGRPILWHIMNIYGAHGITEFIVCCGYKGGMIKEYFYNYHLRSADVTFDLRENQMQVHNHRVDPWKVSLIDTGEETMTGGRLKRVRQYIGSETFCMTYGDGVSDVDLTGLIKFHRRQKTLATLTAVRPAGRFGVVALSDQDDIVRSFAEKQDGDSGYVNGGFFVLEPAVFDMIADDSVSWEHDPMARLSEMEQLSAWRHDGFWQPMDTLRDKLYLEKLWSSGQAPWKVW